MHEVVQKIKSACVLDMADYIGDISEVFDSLLISCLKNSLCESAH